MKSIFTIVLLSAGLIFSSCYMTACPENFKNFQSIEEIDKWVSCNIHYKYDPAGDPWQTPEETLSLRTGDCEDMAILWLYLCHENGFGSGYLEIYTNQTGSAFHAVGLLDDYRFHYMPNCPNLVFRWGYDAVLQLAVVKGTNGQINQWDADGFMPSLPHAGQ